MAGRGITIIGTGLIGGSFGLALKVAGFAGEIRGFDTPERLTRALERQAIDRAAADLGDACDGAQIVIIATPVGAILDLLPQVARLVSRDALISDTGSTKLRIVQSAHTVMDARADRGFLGGHPMAGSELTGVEHASADLFSGRRWILTPSVQPAPRDSKVSRGRDRAPHAARGDGWKSAMSPAALLFVELLKSIGAQPLFMDAATHDRAMALLSHLPQLLATTLAARVYEQVLEQPNLLEAAGPGLRDMTRLAGSSYSLWRDILLTNTEAIQEALTRFQQELEHVRENLRTRELETLFEQGALVQSRLRDMV